MTRNAMSSLLRNHEDDGTARMAGDQDETSTIDEHMTHAHRAGREHYFPCYHLIPSLYMKWNTYISTIFSSMH